MQADRVRNMVRLFRAHAESLSEERISGWQATAIDELESHANAVQRILDEHGASQQSREDQSREDPTDDVGDRRTNAQRRATRQQDEGHPESPTS